MKKFCLIIMFLAVLIGECYAGQKVEVEYPNNPIVYNKTLTSANTEYSQILPSNCNKIMVQCRTAYDVKMTYASTESGTTYWTIKANTWYWDDNILGTTRVLYMQSAQAGVVLEILAWY